MTRIEEITKKLIEMGRKDQEVREKEPIDFDAMDKIDKENNEEFKKIFNEVGYISSKYGKEAQSSAFYLVQHMEAEELDFKKKYLKEMKKDMDGVDPEHYAMMVDRIRTYEGKDQLYGTQFMPIDDKANQHNVKLMPLHKPEKVDERRFEIGLDSLDDFIKWIENDLEVTVVR